MIKRPQHTGPFSIEPMDADELAFITNKYKKASGQYMRVMNILLIVVGAVPLIVAIGIFIYTRNPTHFYQAFVSFFSILLVLFLIIALAYYFHEIFNLHRDSTYKTKTIEKCIITEKKYLPVNHTFHFIINSDIRYSLEISEPEYLQFEVGDEINIEYSTYVKEYFGFY